MSRIIKSLISNFVDLFFPRKCFVCAVKLPDDKNIICPKCENKLQFLDSFCPICGTPDEQGDCRVCKTNDFYFTKASSLYLYDDILQKLIHEFKYNEIKKVGKLFGKKVKEYFNNFSPFAKIDIITPVPLHKVKQRTRGFNQSEVLTAEIAGVMNWKHIPNLVKRRRFTETQTKLNKNERKTNVAGAFKLNSKYDIKGKNILIVDDVFTTGSTANSICEILKNGDAEKVFVLTIARAH